MSGQVEELKENESKRIKRDGHMSGIDVIEKSKNWYTMAHSPILVVVNDISSVMNTIEWYILTSIKYSKAVNDDIHNEIKRSNPTRLVRFISSSRSSHSVRKSSGDGGKHAVRLF